MTNRNPECSMLRLEVNQSWLDMPIEDFKDLQNDFKLNYKSKSMPKPKQKLPSWLKKQAKGKSKIIKEFIKILKKERSKKCQTWTHFCQKFSDEFMTLNNESGDSLEDFSGFEKMRRVKTHMFETLKQDFNDPSHWITNLIQKFMDVFNKHYLGLISKYKPLLNLYNQNIQITSGDLTCEEVRANDQIDYEMLKNETLMALSDRCLHELKTMLISFVDSIPYFYNNCISKNMFSFLKDDLMTFLVNKVVNSQAYFKRDSNQKQLLSLSNTNCLKTTIQNQSKISSLASKECQYFILLTFSRVKTVNEELQLLKWIKKSERVWKRFKHNGLSLIEDLYNQIETEFRIVQINSYDDFSAENLNFESKDFSVKQSENSPHVSTSTKFREIYLKYDSAASKINTLNYCQTPYEKILMIKWVAESIKQDIELNLSSSSKSVMMCADTMVSIYSYIIAFSGNHLLYSHLFIANSLTCKQTRDVDEEGYYLCTLEAALSMLWEYEMRTDELMMTITQYEESVIRDPKRRDFYDSFMETAPTPCPKGNEESSEYTMIEPYDGSMTCQLDFYIPKSTFKL